MADTPSPMKIPADANQARPTTGELHATHATHLLNHLPDAILCIDSHWIITFANLEAQRISHIDPATLGHKTYWELYPEALGTPLETLFRDVMATRIASRLEHFYAPFQRWFEINVLANGDDGIALHYRDITSHKQAEALHATSSRQLQQVFDVEPNSVICIDHNWNCIYFNRTASRFLKTDDLLGANLWERFPIHQQEPFASNYRRTMEQRILTEFEAYYPEPLNLWSRIWVRPYDDGIMIFASNISSRKRAEAVRDATVRELQQVLEATSDGVTSLSHDWTFTFLNQQAVSILGRSDLIGRNIWEEFPAAIDSDFYKFYQRTMRDRVPTQFEAFYPSPLNIWFSVQCRPSEEGVVIFFSDVTERHTSELFLIEQQNLLTEIQQLSHIATWNVDVFSGHIHFGKGSFDVYGRPLSSVGNMEDFRKIVLPSHWPRIEKVIQQAIGSEQTETVEFQAITPDGSHIWLESRLRATVNNGEIIHLRGITFDIHARKQSEEALLASEARYRVLADLNPQALWIGTSDGHIVYANQNFLDYIGRDIETIGGLGWLSTFDPADQGRVLDAWTRSVVTGDEYLIDARLCRASDGALRWWNLRALPVRDESGAIQQWLGVANDIHDSKIAAEALRQEQAETERQRAELEVLYRTAPIGLALFDPIEFRYLRLNDRQAAFFGIPASQILGKTLTEMAPISGLQETFEQVASGQPIINHLLEGRLATDSPDIRRYWTVNYFPVFAADGSVQAISAATLEITHQKKAELALIQSEKLAAVGRLASSISHEINNPLEAITNLLFLIGLDDELPETTKSYVHTAQGELSRVSQIVTQTLRFHRQAIRPTSVAAADLVTAVLNLYQGRLANSGIHVEARYNSQTRISCFENDIRQVLNNLIANAIDAMRGGGKLLIRAHDATTGHGSDTPRKGVRITIADTGHGMSPEVCARIYEPFYTTKDLNGTGLGLWISAGIVAHHQGRLTVRSNQSPLFHGTIFSLFLPLLPETLTGANVPHHAFG